MSLVWFRTPKCAGTSFHIALKNAGKYVVDADPVWGTVLSIPGFQNHLWRQQADRNPEYWKRATKFAVVRNPWDKFLSACEFVQMRGFLRDKTWKEIAFDPPTKFNSHPEMHITRSFTDFLVDKDEGVLVDEIFRFEQLEDAWKKIQEELCISTPLPHLNSSNNKPYKEVYGDDQEWIDQVGKLFEKDIDWLGYSY